MKYYKDNQNKVYAYESDGSQDKFIKPGLTPISEQEALDIANPTPTPDQLAAQVRAERDAKIESIRWRIERAKDELDLGVPLTEPLEPLLQHVQALRDVPLQAGFPEAVEWPPEP